MKVHLLAGFILMSLTLLDSRAQERGFDRESFTVTFYNRSDLLDSLLSRPYKIPIDFRLECFGENPPFSGCKLIEELADGNDWSAHWQGVLIVPSDGEYTFRFTDVDDGARLFLNWEEIADNGWYFPDPDQQPSPQTIMLSAGMHEIGIDYKQRFAGAASLEVRWVGPDFTDELVPMAGPPPFSTSLYVTNDILTADSDLNHETLNELGCFAALKGKDEDVLVLLDFGEPTVDKEGRYGTILNFPALGEKPDTLFTFEIREAAISFLEGYSDCSNNFSAGHLTLAIGTKNTGILAEASPQAEEHGQAWAELVNDVDAWIKAANRSKRLDVVGAIDIETWRKSDSLGNIISEIGPDGARLWAKAYVDSTKKPYYNYGTCEDCLGAGGQMDANSGNLDAKVEGTMWSLDDWWYLSWGIEDENGQAGRAYPVPEIYGLEGSNTNSRQWRDLMKYALNKCGNDEKCRSLISFPGTLTECGVENPLDEEVNCRNDNTNRPAEGWQQLYEALLAVPETAHAASLLRWSTDIINLRVYKPVAVSVDLPSGDALAPRTFNLGQNYPNPFNPSTTIEYALPQPSHVVLKVYDVLGKEIRTLVDAKQPAGHYRVQLDGKTLPGGVYLYRIQAGDFAETKKLTLLR